MHLDDVYVPEVAKVGNDQRLSATRRRLPGRRRDLLSRGFGGQWLGRGRFTRRHFRRFRCRTRRRRASNRHRADHVAGRNLVTHRNRQRVDDPVLRRGNVYRGLVGLERDQTVFAGDAVTGANQHFDDLDVLEVAEIRDDDVHTVRHACLPTA